MTVTLPVWLPVNTTVLAVFIAFEAFYFAYRGIKFIISTGTGTS